MFQVTGSVWGGGGEAFVHGCLEGDLSLSEQVEKMGARGVVVVGGTKVDAWAFPLSFLPALTGVDVATGGRRSGGEWCTP